MATIFSIIIPTYNSAATLSDALQSIVDQSFKNFEILIMDGVSTDNTLDIARSFSDERIRIYSEKDSGVYDAMNKGIDKAHGEWLYFLGSDDTLYDYEVLHDMANIIETKPESQFVYGNAYFLKRKEIWDGEFTLHKLLFDRNICHQAIFFRRDIFHLVGKYDLQYKVFADWDLNIRIFWNPLIVKNFYDRIIANYLDGQGISTDFQHLDRHFMEKLPLNYYYKIIDLEKTLEGVYRSKSFRLGSFLLSPFKKLFKR